ncbi:MAG TPA: DUF937 domain-containing protein [Microvirga sp.]|jgi:hypothetical protein|nr:DUF937 domain-containing protein [Microvirga sp.]
MLNWFDLMRQAQGGAAFDNMARQFGLSPEQVQRATVALLPAFAMGLQRNAANPNGMEQFFKLMSAGHYPSFFESAAQAFTPQARQEGTTVLNQLFGSDDVSRRVAQQAAAVSGVGADILQQMLPLMAGIFAGGLAQFARSAPMAGPMTAAFTPEQKPPSSPGQTGFGAWADLWSGFLGEGAKPAATANPAPGSFDEMMASFLAAQRGAAPRAAEASKPEADAPKPDAAGAFEAWGQMMESGREMQQQHLASLQSIFDSMWRRAGDKEPGGDGKGS